MKYGLALEGGGAKGAYQIGVVKALIDNGYEFEAVVGTSIGALNAAMVVQDRIDDAIDLWSNISYEKMFNVDDKKVSSALSAKIDLEIVKYFSSKFGQILKNGGISTENIRKILIDNVDEKKVRKSKMKFGLVTVCLSDKEVKQVFIDEIPKGELIDYLMATSSLPVFKRAKIDNKSYLDGGVYDNCPVEMLEKKGIKNVIAISNYKKENVHMTYTVGQMAKMLGLAGSTLRYYDKEGLLPFVERSSGGIRMFREKDYEWLQIIECLKKAGMSIKDIKKYIVLLQQGDSTIQERLELFQHQRTVLLEQMASLQQTLNTLDYKCWYYETALKAGTTDILQNMPIEDIPEQFQEVRQNLTHVPMPTSA